ncbi:MAG: single-stranded DNA-binding protein [Armatimonadetes bacterium]|nr:single-stranded DNA-binding protein [Armatimonadota bacterium]
MINNVVLVGRLTKDPEMRYTQNGIAVTRFTLAVDRPFGRDEAGNKQTDFINIVAWRKTAELCGQYLSKGAPVGVEGRVQTRAWTTQDGQPRKDFEVQADRISFLESRAERERREAGRTSAPPSQAGGRPPDEEPPFDDVPEPMDADDPFGDQ